jgi:hypothetical protein
VEFDRSKAPAPEGYGTRMAVERLMLDRQFRVDAAATLADLAKDYALFNHGAFFIYGKLDTDPAADYVDKQPDAACTVSAYTFSRPLFHGLSAPGRKMGPPIDWDRTLFFVERRHWPGLYDHLRTCAWIDRRRKFYGRAVPQILPLLDFLALDRARILPAPLPTVEVTVFGVDGTNAHVQFTPRTRLPGDTPSAVHLPLVEETKTLGAALLAGADRPFRFIEGDPLLTIQEMRHRQSSAGGGS